MYTINPQKIPTMKEIALEMRNRAWSTGKNFALIGMLFSVYECNIETYRGKSDLWNGFLGGFCTGGTLGKKMIVKIYFNFNFFGLNLFYNF
jgi:mitochondrial import inner membrane translocase subunit TIM22